MRASTALFSFVKAWEGCNLSPHWDAIGKVWDIGFGHVFVAGEERRDISEDEADMLLRWDMRVNEDGASRMVKVPLAQHQFDTCCSFIHNVGLDDDDDAIAEGFGDSRFLKLINLGAFDAAAAQLPLWCHAKGEVVNGLLKRRVAECAMFVHADYSGRP